MEGLSATMERVCARGPRRSACACARTVPGSWVVGWVRCESLGVVAEFVTSPPARRHWIRVLCLGLVCICASCSSVCSLRRRRGGGAVGDDGPRLCARPAPVGAEPGWSPVGSFPSPVRTSAEPTWRVPEKLSSARRYCGFSYNSSRSQSLSMKGRATRARRTGSCSARRSGFEAGRRSLNGGEATGRAR